MGFFYINAHPIMGGGGECTPVTEDYHGLIPQISTHIIVNPIYCVRFFLATNLPSFIATSQLG